MAVPYKKITAGVLITAASGLAAWDVVVATNKRRGDTISEILLNSARRVPALAFGLGFIMGHLFWPQDLDT